MLNELVFNGQDLKDYGVAVKGDRVFDSPERDVETISIPGRNGDLVIDNGRYKNIPVKYPAYILKEFKEPSYFDGLKAYLLSCIGNKRIEDTYHPEEYMMGRLTSKISPEIYEKGNAGTFELEFDCDPRRFLKSGERTFSYTDDATIYNPTMYPSKPLVRAYGTGTVEIGSTTITINTANVYTDIDCELMDAYKGTTNCNGNITLSSGGYFEIEPGNHGISLGTGITQVDITPRWFTI